MDTMVRLLLLALSLFCANAFAPNHDFCSNMMWKQASSTRLEAALGKRERIRRAFSRVSPRKFFGAGEKNVLAEEQQVSVVTQSPEDLPEVPSERTPMTTSTAVLEKEPETEEDEVATLVAEVDDKLASSNAEEAYGLLKSESLLVVANADLLWRYAKCCYEMFDIDRNEKLQEKYIRDGVKITEIGIERFPDSALILKWNAILLGKLGQFQPTKEKMQNSFKIRDKLLLALEKLPTDASVMEALGEWSFKVAGISFVERQAAKLLFGTPPQSSYDEALRYFLESFDARPSKKVATKISSSLQKTGNQHESKEWAEKAKQLD